MVRSFFCNKNAAPPPSKNHKQHGANLKPEEWPLSWPERRVVPKNLDEISGKIHIGNRSRFERNLGWYFFKTIDLVHCPNLIVKFCLFWHSCIHIRVLSDKSELTKILPAGVFPIFFFFLRFIWKQGILVITYRTSSPWLFYVKKERSVLLVGGLAL